MGNPQTAPVLKLLAKERAALRRGDIAAALAVGPHKEAAIARLTPSLSSQEVTALRQAAERNCTLLQAALDGWKAAVGLRRGLRETTKEFQHYQKDGHKISLTPTATSPLSARR